MASTFQRYIETGKSISKARSTSFLYETSRLLLHRVVTGYGPDHYTIYSLFKKPVNFNAWRQYLDKRDFCKLLSRYNKKENFKVLEDKVAFAGICRQHELPHPQIEFTCNYSSQGSLFADFTSSGIAEGFAGLAPGDYIVKTSGGSYGINLWSIERTADGIQLHNTGQRLTTEEFAALLLDSGESYLVQKKIEVAQTLKSIMPGLASGSMRIYTFRRPDGSVSIPYSLVKLPVVGQVSDNFANGTSGNLSALINMEDHTLRQVLVKAAGGLYEEVVHHPDTGVDLRNYPLPELQQALDLGYRCALAFPDIPAVGWDIVVTDQGAYVLEGNPMFDPYGLQRCAGRGARDFVPKLLEKIPANESGREM